METTLYIDESGDPANPLDENGNFKLRSSTVFTLGGIIVSDSQKKFLEEQHKALIEKYFQNIPLPTNFKLHSNPLRMNEFPYNQLERKDVLYLENEIFTHIKKSGASLICFSIDLVGHYQYYTKHAVNPLAFGLIVLIERLLYFMRTNHISSANVVYERFTESLRDMVHKEQNYLRNTNFRTNVDLKKLFNYITSGNPVKEVVLQYADFWAYIPFNKLRSEIRMERFPNIFNYNTEIKRGNVEIKYNTGP